MMKDGCFRPPGSIWDGRAAGWRKGVISRGRNHRLLHLLPWVSMRLVFMKEAHSPTRVDDDDPEDDAGDSPIFNPKVSISLDVKGRCV